MSENLKTYEIYVRESANSLKIVRHTCQAENQKQAQEIFVERLGNGLVVAGPNLAKTPS